MNRRIRVRTYGGVGGRGLNRPSYPIKSKGSDLAKTTASGVIVRVVVLADGQYKNLARIVVYIVYRAPGTAAIRKRCRPRTAERAAFLWKLVRVNFDHREQLCKRRYEVGVREPPALDIVKDCARKSKVPSVVGRHGCILQGRAQRLLRSLLARPKRRRTLRGLQHGVALIQRRQRAQADDKQTDGPHRRLERWRFAR